MSRPALRRVRARARAARGWALGLYIAGIGALGVGLLVGGIVAAAASTPAGFAVAAVIAAAGIGTGALGLWESRRFGRRASVLERTLSEQRLWELAKAHGGALGVIDVAHRFGVPSPEAEAMLDGLVDEIRVSMEVTDQGEVRYVFRDPGERGPPRVRVEEQAPEAESESDARAEVARRRSK